MAVAGGSHLIDNMFRAIIVIVAIAVLILYSMPFEAPYNQKLVILFTEPWWRFLIVAAVVAAAMWCPRVGIAVTLVAFFYLADLGTLVTPFVDAGEHNA
jgi:hypothetical protein